MAMTLKSLHPLRYIEDAEDGDIPFVATPSAESTMAEIEEYRFEDCLKLHHIVESDILLTVDGLPSVTTAYYKEQLTVVQTVREFEDLSNNMSVPVLTRTLQGQAVYESIFALANPQNGILATLYTIKQACSHVPGKQSGHHNPAPRHPPDEASRTSRSSGHRFQSVNSVDRKGSAGNLPRRKPDIYPWYRRRVRKQHSYCTVQRRSTLHLTYVLTIYHQ
ncbi:hypothetical protein T310_3445 [Rasamsonia emersonii CBS 393.64]|uniref:Uncharacterized protein n=1 Tax=Rasamsonia emersonii (strain ATCC 16479 / CBS 393.64 / IMI 116815) TaxID=1408163 RepID=A0A0F4YW54_RASE3|nr:hypothetical protein T310_3445 [Rasamsonia emersonii CBS 393.64]KKA22532.1 hypothetical protein T310_3445 [Rasamsonia emersonii CBS 393.64]